MLQVLVKVFGVDHNAVDRKSAARVNKAKAHLSPFVYGIRCDEAGLWSVFCPNLDLPEGASHIKESRP